MSKNLYCPNFLAALTTTNDKGQKIAVAGRCKQWSCKFCARKNREKWQAVLLDYINKSDQDWCWFTLTSHRNAHKTSRRGVYSLLNIKNAWDRLTKRMRRKYGHFEYCRVYEKHKSGAFHLHCIRSGAWDDLTTRNRGKKSAYEDSKWLRKTAASLGMGYMTHADNIERKKRGVVVFYVAKYMVKLEGNGGDDWRGVRRIQTSRGIKYNQPSENKWEFKSGLYERELLTDERTYYLVNEKRLLNWDDFDNDIAWPPSRKGSE